MRINTTTERRSNVKNVLENESKHQKVIKKRFCFAFFTHFFSLCIFFFCYLFLFALVSRGKKSKRNKGTKEKKKREWMVARARLKPKSFSHNIFCHIESYYNNSHVLNLRKETHYSEVKGFAESATHTHSYARTLSKNKTELFESVTVKFHRYIAKLSKPFHANIETKIHRSRSKGKCIMNMDCSQ